MWEQQLKRSGTNKGMKVRKGYSVLCPEVQYDTLGFDAVCLGIQITAFRRNLLIRCSGRERQFSRIMFFGIVSAGDFVVELRYRQLRRITRSRSSVGNYVVLTYLCTEVHIDSSVLRIVILINTLGPLKHHSIGGVVTFSLLLGVKFIAFHNESNLPFRSM
jgi:hypothetical protein